MRTEYSDEQLVADAKRFSTRAAWRVAGEQERIEGHQSHYGTAVKRGHAFMQQCCAHMLSGLLGNKHNLKYTDDDLISSAKSYQHKSDWKKADSLRFNMALLRPEVYASATAHMMPKAHPYSGSYIVYAYEFADRHAYVGHTFQPGIRRTQHMQRGPVLLHMAACPDYSYKVLEAGIDSPVESAKAETGWQAKYLADGWTPLWTAKAGGLGTIQVTKWTKENVMAEAKKYKTKQEWIDGSQMSYRIAKREGWFEEASAHMPKRVLGVGAGVAKTPEAREKMRQAKLGTQHTPEMKAARSEATRKWWAARRAGTQAESTVNKLLDLQ